jgi:peptidoglycan/xylan/chitin deacetylase (PgdA/CDA1 family)
MHPTDPSLKALPQILEKINKRGFKFGTVSELITP